MPSTAVTASGTAAGSATAANSKTQTPSGNSSARPAATSVARRVLPTPPTPVKRSAALTSSTSDSRPIKLVIVGRKFPGFESTLQNGGKSVCRPGARTWKNPTGVGTSRNLLGPRSTRSTPLSHQISNHRLDPQDSQQVQAKPRPDDRRRAQGALGRRV